VERDWTKGIGWEKLRDFRNLALMTSEIVGILRSLGGRVGDILRGIEDSAEDFGLETLDALDVGWLG
jgi:hypothetical protein